jgi:hypothetical protein
MSRAVDIFGNVESKMGKINRIDCHKCRYYFVTWVPAQPHGCRAMGFRSFHLPSSVVYKNSGAKCEAFKQKKKVAPLKKANRNKA